MQQFSDVSAVVKRTVVENWGATAWMRVGSYHRLGWGSELYTGDMRLLVFRAIFRNICLRNPRYSLLVVDYQEFKFIINYFLFKQRDVKKIVIIDKWRNFCFCIF